MNVREPEPIPRVTLRVPDEACVALGVSHDFFDRHVRSELRLIKRGRLWLVATAELEEWARRSQARYLS